MPLYRRVGNASGEATCIYRLGDMALRRGDHLNAQALYEQALTLYRHVSSVLGEANCIQGLGDVALLLGQSSEASAKFEEALRLFEKIAEPYSIGQCHVRLARLTIDAQLRQQHVDAARAAWKQIDRTDLIQDLDEEFNPTEN